MDAMLTDPNIANANTFLDSILNLVPYGPGLQDEYSIGMMILKDAGHEIRLVGQFYGYIHYGPGNERWFIWDHARCDVAVYTPDDLTLFAPIPAMPTPAPE